MSAPAHVCAHVWQQTFTGPPGVHHMLHLPPARRHLSSSWRNLPASSLRHSCPVSGAAHPPIGTMRSISAAAPTRADTWRGCCPLLKAMVSISSAFVITGASSLRVCACLRPRVCATPPPAYSAGWERTHKNGQKGVNLLPEFLCSAGACQARAACPHVVCVCLRCSTRMARSPVPRIYAALIHSWWTTPAG